jgi:hypothetical protein
MRENALIVASLLTWSRDPSPLWHHPSVYSYCLATNEARLCDTMSDSSRLGSALLNSALLRSAQRKHRFVYCCIIVGACFDVTVLAWRKYATIYEVCSKSIEPSFFPRKPMKRGRLPSVEMRRGHSCAVVNFFPPAESGSRWQSAYE